MVEKMKKNKVLFIVVFGIFFCVSGFAQSQNADPLEERRKRDQQRALEAWRKSNRDPEVTIDKHLKTLRRLLVQKHQILAKRPWITSKTNQILQNRITPQEEYLSKYRDFLRRKNTGIFRVFEDTNCGNRNVVSVKDGCAEYVPGSSTYSFRQGFHVSEPIHDLRFTGNSFVSKGVLALAIFSTMGDLDLDSLDLSHPGLKFITGFRPAKELDGIKKQAATFSKGVSYNNFLYKNSAPINVGNVYVLRVVAYRVNNIRKLMGKNWEDLTLEDLDVYSEMRGIPDYKIKPNRRMDITIAFKIANRGSDGGLTIIWKRLSKAKAPKITV